MLFFPHLRLLSRCGVITKTFFWEMLHIFCSGGVRKAGHLPFPWRNGHHSRHLLRAYHRDQVADGNWRKSSLPHSFSQKNICGPIWVWTCRKFNTKISKLSVSGYFHLYFYHKVFSLFRFRFCFLNVFLSSDCTLRDGIP